MGLHQPRCLHLLPVLGHPPQPRHSSYQGSFAQPRLVERRLGGEYGEMGQPEGQRVLGGHAAATSSGALSVDRASKRCFGGHGARVAGTLPPPSCPHCHGAFRRCMRCPHPLLTPPSCLAHRAPRSPSRTPTRRTTSTRPSSATSMRTASSLPLARQMNGCRPTAGRWARHRHHSRRRPPLVPPHLHRRRRSSRRSSAALRRHRLRLQ